MADVGAVTGELREGADSRRWSRRTFLRGAIGAGAITTGSTSVTARATRPAVTAESIATGFTAPVDVAIPSNRPNRLYVADQPGIVFRVDDGAVVGNPVLDLRDAIVDVGGYDERGLLGLALHPDFPATSRLYVRYSAPPRSGTPTGYDHTFVLSEFEIVDDGTRVVDGSERVLLEIPEPQSNHNGGSLVFGPDGYLYVGVGDGGAAGDQGLGHVTDWYDRVDGGNGQDVTANLLGSILRIDPDTRSGDRAYGIPDDNPLVGQRGLDEHYAWGLRNPWRMSFDGSDLYVADVGQDQYEEVNRVRSGGNYGWNVREGTACYHAADCPATTPTGKPLRDPIIQYSQAADDGDPGGAAVIGGYRYRGTRLDGLSGAYLFTDWRFNGRLFAARPDADDGLWPITVHPMTGVGDPLGQFALAFARTPDDELLICTTDRASVDGQTGAIHRLTGIESGTTTTTESTTTPTTSTRTDGQPGFGIFGTAIALGGLATYGLYRRLAGR